MMDVLARAWRLRITVVLACAVALTAASAAYAWEHFIYYNGTLSPGGFASTSGEAYRYYNLACRNDGNSGRMSVGYLRGGSLIYWSGVKYTQCPDAKVQLDIDGTYMSRCYHEGTVTFAVICQTTRPT